MCICMYGSIWVQMCYLFIYWHNTMGVWVTELSQWFEAGLTSFSPPGIEIWLQKQWQRGLYGWRTSTLSRDYFNYIWHRGFSANILTCLNTKQSCCFFNKLVTYHFKTYWMFYLESNNDIKKIRNECVKTNLFL